MKTLAKTMFVLLILMAGSLGMLGQKTLLIHDIRPLLAYSSDIQSDIELSAEHTASSYWFYMEEKVQLEDWMIEQSEWKDESNTVPGSAVKVEPEPELRIESWMIQPFTAGSQETWDFLVETIEEPLEVRKWMICCTDWNLKTRQAGLLKIPAITIQ
ncbi:MAG: hypothetical protein AMS26_03270 [Bacteroides sp. SM23_62]|nr:MAG: hypothetical protein AMS26_03270 [Bacteroides sp. SM23_62]